MADFIGDDGSSTITLLADGAAATALSPDQARLYVATLDGKIRVFDLVTHQEIATWDVGSSLGGISVAEDGSYLLVVERDAPNGLSVIYRVETATGDAQALSTTGSAFIDVEIVDQNTALITGGQTNVTQLDLSTNTFSSLAGGVDYSNRSVLTEDSRFTLLAEPGISNGPLLLYDDQSGSIVARGDSYSSPVSGFNFGIQAISEKAGLVLQFVNRNSVNVYDLNLDYLETIDLGYFVDGLTFDASGKFVYSYQIEEGKLVKYSVDGWEVIEEYNVDTATWHNNIGYGDQILVDDVGRFITVMSNDGSGKVELIDLSVRFETFDGTDGADSFTGGKGDDVYVINDPEDAIIEHLYEGADEAKSLISFVLPEHIENLTLIGLDPINGTGNGEDNSITGNSAANFIEGLGGNDLLFGQGGGDTLQGSDGNDWLDGGNDADALRGQYFDLRWRIGDAWQRAHS